MENHFAIQTKSLISYSREIALEMGYQYISTLHFFFADCESKSTMSLKKLCFANDSAYLEFKNGCVAEKNVSILENLEKSLPITKEFEITLRQAELERQKYNQRQVYPHHVFLAAFKNSQSVLCEAFNTTSDLVLKVEHFYLKRGAFEIDLIQLTDDKKVDNKNVGEAKTIFGFIKKLFPNRD